jgi:hypothetical protein
MNILGWWNRRGSNNHDQQDGKLVKELVDQVVQITNPRLRYVPRYESRLTPAVITALDYARGIVDAMPASRAASAEGWTSDPCVHAFFASADDIKQAFSRSDELRAYFNRNPGSAEVYALLSMEMTEKKILGMALEGEIIRRDIPQTTISFGDYRIRFCKPTEPDLRQEIRQRIVDQLALEGLAYVAEDRTSREQFEKERALLKVRLRLLERQGAGMKSALGGTDLASQSELTRLQAQIAENSQNLANAGVGAEILERELERIREVLAQPGQNFPISAKRLCLDRMNVVLEDNNPQGTMIEFTVGQTIGSRPQKRAFALTSFLRQDLLPGGIRYDGVSPR